jgi:RinA family phage transcriptional activator
LKKIRKEMVKALENHIRHYKAYKVGIKNIEKQIEWIMPSMTAQYSANEGSSGTFNITSKVETAVLDRLESTRAIALKTEKERYEIIIEAIDNAYDELDEIEKKFVKLRYFDKKSMHLVSVELKYSESYLKKIRNRLMDKLLISLGSILKLG